MEKKKNNCEKCYVKVKRVKVGMVVGLSLMFLLGIGNATVVTIFAKSLVPILKAILTVNAIVMIIIPFFNLMDATNGIGKNHLMYEEEILVNQLR